MKNNIRILRGTPGPRGMPGQSAYGLWLQEGNQGDMDAFFSSIGASREVLYSHAGGQVIGSCKAVQLQRMAGQFKPGRYIIQFMLCAQKGTFALFYDAIEIPHTRYQARGVLHGLCVIHIVQDSVSICIRNIASHAVQLEGGQGCVDAFLWARPID